MFRPRSTIIYHLCKNNSQAIQLYNFVMYADDIILSTSLNSLSKTTLNNKSTETIINEELSKIIEWLNINKLLNKSKTKSMDFHMPNKRMQTLTLKIYDVYIERVDEFNCLGLTLDTNLNWRKHTEKISYKCSKTIGILTRLKRIITRHKYFTLQYLNIITHKMLYYDLGISKK